MDSSVSIVKTEKQRLSSFTTLVGRFAAKSVYKRCRDSVNMGYIANKSLKE